MVLIMMMMIAFCYGPLACRMASAKSVTVVIPCFPYAREPDAPYKRNGMPRARVPPERFAQEQVLALAADRLRFVNDDNKHQQQQQQQQHQHSSSRSNSPHVIPNPGSTHDRAR